jgi:A/G-specific adenine glycosylase
MRVLCRLDGVEADPREKQTLARLWLLAEELVPRRRPGDFNSALMELGATVCTPRNPQCLICPAAKHCQAAAAGIQDRIPPSRKSKPTPLVRRYTYCIRHRGRWLIERRPDNGRWAGMWQFVTINAPEPERLPVQVRELRPAGKILHQLTHRRYEFDVFVADAISSRTRDADRTRKWVTASDLESYPLPRPHVRAMEMMATFEALALADRMQVKRDVQCDAT